MSTLSKVFVILILIISLVYLGVTATLFAHRVEYKKKLADLVAKYDKDCTELKDTIGKRETEISTLQAAVGTEKASTAKAETDLADRTAELQRKTTDMDDLKDKYAKIADKVGAVEKQIKEERDRNEALQKNVEELRAQKDAAITDRDTTQAKLLDTENRLAVSEKNLADLEVQYITRMKDLEEAKLQLSKLQEAGIPVEVISTGMQKHVEGKVLAVSSKLDLMIISAGKDKGVEQGYQFTVFRGGKYIGKIQVQKADKDWSSATTLRNFMKEGEGVQVGDSVSTRP